MAKCPQCKEEIDNDSCFCDQCGCQLYICPNCHIIGKGEGKRCGQCGKLLVAASASVSRRQDSLSEPSLSPLRTALPGVGIQQSEASYLVCAAQNLRLKLVENAVIGRVHGDYSQELSNMIYISGTHARLNKVGTQWSITDLGSRNGTKVNGIPCNPTLNFTIGDVVRIANYYDFKVE